MVDKRKVTFESTSKKKEKDSQVSTGQFSGGHTFTPSYTSKLQMETGIPKTETPKLSLSVSIIILKLKGKKSSYKMVKD